MATGLSTEETIEIRFALEELNAAFVHHLDHGEVDELAALFCDDALYTHGERRSAGRQAIEALFRGRGATTPRTSRHIYSGLRLNIRGAMRATGTSVCLTFAADGLPPLPATPLLVADFEDVYQKTTNGWKFKERHIHRIFEAPGSPGPIGLGLSSNR